MSRMKASTILILAMLGGVVDAQENLPRYEPATCPFEGAAGRDDVHCGYLVVAENRDRPDGRTLRLSVAVLKSLSDTPLSDPLVYLSGGPGGPSVKHSIGRLGSSFWTPLREKRDLIFFDQRGVGFSDPEFCSEMSFSLYTATFRGLSADERRTFVVNAVNACRESMLAEGIDFGFYNSTAIARDLDDLRSVLGYQRWNLFGISFGTRVALAAMRDFPDGIRSVIIDSNWPPNAPLADINENLARSLRLVFDQCAASADCSAAFPMLERDFLVMLDDFEARPLVLELGDPDRFPDGRIVVDGNLLTWAFFQGLYDRNFIDILPLLVRELRGRNGEVLAALADGLVLEPGFSSGLKYAVDCYEWITRITPEMAEADQSRHPEFKVWQPYADERAICAAWHDQRAEVSEIQPVYSEIPTLVASGEFDPITPPSYGRLTAASLPNSTYIEVRGVGHAATPFTECTNEILDAFLEDPTDPINTDCVAGIAPASFTTDVFMNAGVYRLAKLLQNTPAPAHIASLGLILLLLLSAVVIWPLAWVVRRVRRRDEPAQLGANRARLLAAFTSLLALGFLVGLGAVVFITAQENPFLLGFGVPGSASPIFFLPWLVVLATFGIAMFAITAWKEHWWGLAGRVHYLLVTIACVGFVVWIFGIDLI